MRPDTQQALHFGVNFIFAPALDLAPDRILSLQQELARYGLVFDQTQRAENKIALVREAKPLQVTLLHPQPPLTQFLIVAPHPERVSEDFVREAEQVVSVVRETWPDQKIQLVRRDCTVRFLYTTVETHAFQFLWESRLGQDAEGIKALGRAVTGGGLRIVMPSTDPREAQIEVKVEGYLVDSTKLFVETQFVWQAPPPEGTDIDSTVLLEEVLEYAEGPVIDFITVGT